MKNLKKTSCLLMLSFASLTTFAQTLNISGTVTGMADGTWLYLRSSSPARVLDSTKIMNGKFKLAGTTGEEVSHLTLHTANYQNYLFFWAEANTHLEIKNGAFKKAVISGSKTQLENEQLAKIQLPITKKEDSLSRLYQSEKNTVTKEKIREKIKALRAESQELEISYVKEHPNSLISAYILDVYASTWGKQKAASLYAGLSKAIKNTSYGKNINTFITLNKDIQLGNRFVDFEQLNAAGKKIKLSDIKGKYILLEFWGSWCGPCRQENPNLVKTYYLYKDKGFNVLGVAADENKAQWLKAIKDDQLPWENVCDLKGDKNQAALIYGINAYPTNFLIDNQGIIIAKNLRGNDLTKKLAELLP